MKIKIRGQDNNIPDLDERGNLPSGIHFVTFENFVRHFGGSKSLKRSQLIKCLTELLNFARYYAKEIYIDGSFVTSKLAPNDIDLIIVFEDKFENNINGIKRFEELQAKYNGKLHIFARLESTPFPKQDFLSFFQETREDTQGQKHPKGIISLEIKK